MDSSVSPAIICRSFGWVQEVLPIHRSFRQTRRFEGPSFYKPLRLTVVLDIHMRITLSEQPFLRRIVFTFVQLLWQSGFGGDRWSPLH